MKPSPCRIALIALAAAPFLASAGAALAEDAPYLKFGQELKLTENNESYAMKSSTHFQKGRDECSLTLAAAPALSAPVMPAGREIYVDRGRSVADDYGYILGLVESDGREFGYVSCRSRDKEKPLKAILADVLGAEAKGPPVWPKLEPKPDPLPRVEVRYEQPSVHELAQPAAINGETSI